MKIFNIALGFILLEVLHDDKGVKFVKFHLHHGKNVQDEVLMKSMAIDNERGEASEIQMSDIYEYILYSFENCREKKKYSIYICLCSLLELCSILFKTRDKFSQGLSV